MAVACDDPPSECVTAPGTCVLGACEYAPAGDGTTCDDGQACTTGDACAAGVCVGSVVVCDAPPGPADCWTGACVAGTCVYDFLAGAACDDGDGCTGPDTCVSGTCYGSAVDCGALPPACADSTTVRTYSGTCTSGACGFTDTPCPAYCADGTCTNWVPTVESGAPAERARHTAVWTGSEMIIWGGQSPGPYLASGGRYLPVADAWTPTPASPLGERAYHAAVWTGSEMLVWGGLSYDAGFLVSYSDGARLDPATGAWTLMAATAAPAARGSHTAVWTGSEMVVWGGLAGGISSVFGDGGRYDPAADTWAPVATAGAPSARYLHTAVWTGSEMIVWGGTPGFPADGAGYDPVSDTWTSVPGPAVPWERACHTAVWTGSQMIVWGGGSECGASWVDTGGRFDPLAGTWTDVTTAGAPSARTTHTAVWTGSEMIVWGGYASCGGCCFGAAYYCADGGRYDPTADSWTPVDTAGAPQARLSHTAVWSGTSMIVWGGVTDGIAAFLDSGGRYAP